MVAHTPEAVLAIVRSGFASGMTVLQASREAGVSKSAVYRAAREGRLDLTEAAAARRGAPPGTDCGPVAIPKWVRSAGLAEDSRDLTRVFDEHHAARWCRRLAAEARAL